jgi:hypothetical protein
VISVVTYGRNDNYGFNLYKRTAMGFNCLAEVLGEEDEILFVDYNTPAHLPTLPEFIWDTLTDKALRLLQVIRILPEVHERIKADSPLKILENVSRNAAIVRSNPANHWVLSTNPDVLLVLASQWNNLDSLLATLPDSFYEMPRFDIPESVWSSLPRREPARNLQLLRDFLIHHRLAVAETLPDYRFQKFYLFDAPGDFQLAPRDYYFRLRGFDESMNKYLHSDSNLAKRMWLLNGERTDHLLGHLWVLHQDHYLSGEWARNVSTIEPNDPLAKVFHQQQIEANHQGWGLQDVDLPMFRMAERMQVQACRFSLLPRSEGELPLSRDVDWSTQPFYRLAHYHPEVITAYLREFLQVIPGDSLICYLGNESSTLQQVRQAWQEISPSGPAIEDLAEAAERNGSAVKADVLLVDLRYERSAECAERIRTLQEKLDRQVAAGRMQQLEADDELTKFADEADHQALQSRLFPLWEDLVSHVRIRPGGYLILLGCNPYSPLLFEFQETYAQCSLKQRTRSPLPDRLYAYYQRFKLAAYSEQHRNPAIKLVFGIRLLKRRLLRKLIGHNSILGALYLQYFIRTHRKPVVSLNARTLYVHHRLMVMQMES